MTPPEVVVKVGGSLLDQPNLGPRLGAWLDALPRRRTLLLVGGGKVADEVRRLDGLHGLGDEAAHWLAVAAMGFNARLLAAVLPQSTVVTTLAACPAAWAAGRTPLLDPELWLRADDARPGALPHSWDVTSDSVAARVAVVTGARELVLLKSCAIEPGRSLEDLAASGVVDSWFPRAAAGVPVVRVLAFP